MALTEERGSTLRSILAIRSLLADRFKLPLGTVKSRMRLGLLAMRRALLGAGAANSADGGPTLWVE